MKVKKEAKEITGLVLKKVIKVLLTEPREKCETTEDIVALIHTRKAGFIAVGRILSEMKASPAVVDFAIGTCLKKAKTAHFASVGGEALFAAGGYIAYDASAEIKNRVIREMARAGWYGRIEHLARQYLSRDLTAKEARLLVSAHINNIASLSTDTEEHLLVIARRCFSASEAEEVEEKIREFKREFDSHLD